MTECFSDVYILMLLFAAMRGNGAVRGSNPRGGRGGGFGGGNRMSSGQQQQQPTSA